MSAISYHIRHVARTYDNKTCVEVEFDNGLQNDFLFVNFPETYHGYPKDERGRPYIYKAVGEYVVDITPHVHKAIQKFAAEIDEKDYKGDMRDPLIPLGYVNASDHPHMSQLAPHVGKKFML